MKVVKKKRGRNHPTSQPFNHTMRGVVCKVPPLQLQINKINAKNEILI